MARWKLGPEGAYYDPNDTGPNQASAEQIAAAQGPGPGLDTTATTQAPQMPGITAGEPSGSWNPPVQQPPAVPEPPQAPQGVLPYDRTQFRDAWMSSGASTLDELNQFLAQYGIGPADSAGRVTLPGNETLDLLIGAHTGSGTPGWTGVGGGGGGAGGAGGGLPPGVTPYEYPGLQPAGPGFTPDSLKSTLAGLFPGGAFNTDLVNRRTELAREDLERQRRSRQSSNQAALASRGLLSEGGVSGAEQTARNRTEQDIADIYSRAVSGIYADESAAADQRMIQALQLATGMTAEEARNALGRYQADIQRELGLGNIDLQRTLGLGNLSLGNLEAMNQYNLGRGQLGLQQRELELRARQGDMEALLELLRQQGNAAGIGAGGYI